MTFLAYLAAAVALAIITIGVLLARSIARDQKDPGVYDGKSMLNGPD